MYSTLCQGTERKQEPWPGPQEVSTLRTGKAYGQPWVLGTPCASLWLTPNVVCFGRVPGAVRGCLWALGRGCQKCGWKKRRGRHASYRDQHEPEDRNVAGHRTRRQVLGELGAASPPSPHLAIKSGKVNGYARQPALSVTSSALNYPGLKKEKKKKGKSSLCGWKSSYQR